MKAMLIRRFGEPDVFEPGELPIPEPGPGQVLIRVAGSSVNPIDVKIRSGAVPAIAPELPAVLHGDVSGVVEAVGPGVTRFQTGDDVFGFAGGCRGFNGALAEFMAADANLLARRPASLDLAQCAVLPIAGITAWESLVERARVQPGQRVLVQGGVGGVGHFGVQLAKACGAIVYTTVSSPIKADIARRLGADFTINYREQAIADYVAEQTNGQGFDVVFDTVGGESLAASFQAVRPGGTVVTIAARSTQDLSPLHARGATLHVVFILLPLVQNRGRERHGETLERLARLVDAGRIRPYLDPEHFTFANVAAAHKKLQDGRAVGKIGLTAEF